VPVSIALGAYGSADSGGAVAVNRRFFDSVRFDISNLDAVSKSFGPVKAILQDGNGSPLSSGQTSGNVTVGAGNVGSLTPAVAVPSNTPNPANLRAELTLPSEGGTTVKFISSFQV